MNLISCAGPPMFIKRHKGFDKTIQIMRLIICLIILSCLQTTAKVYGQQITINVKNASLETVLQQIKKQSGYSLITKDDVLDKTNTITISLKNVSIKQALDECFKNQLVAYELIGKTIVIKAKKQKYIEAKSTSSSEIIIKGSVTDTAGNPLSGGTVKVKGTNKATIIQADGTYEISAQDNATLTFAMLGYIAQEFPVSIMQSGKFNVVMKVATGALSEVSVVSTGYQSLPKERATGSFTQLNNALINRSTSTGILDRISGVASGVLFNNTASSTINTSGYSARNSGINIRGQSTLYAPVNPLIVLDNFPYEGEINNINPNDIESITILKDAAAASIWGASAGNGVIVITTKKGKLNQNMKVDLNANVTVGNKPNLKYDRNFLDASDFIGVEKLLFDQGYFDGDLSDTYAYPAISPAVEILANQRNGTLSEEQTNSQLDALMRNDVRNDFKKYVYQKSIKQQYSVGIRGGTANATYALSVGKDNNRDNLIRNGFDRTTVNSLNTYSPIKNLTVTAGLNYSQNTTYLNNQYPYGDPAVFDMGNGKYNSLYPYASIADNSGNALAIPKNYSSAYLNSIKSQGFLDWDFRPLNEIKNSDNSTRVNDLLMRIAANYKIIPQLNVDIQYQNERQTVNTKNLQSQDSYYTRNLINQFASYDPASNTTTYNFPLGAVLSLGNYNWNSQNFRTQFNFNQTIGKGSITAIAGAEVRERKTDGFLRTSLGYNDEYGTSASYLNYNVAYDTNPSGFNYLPAPSGTVTGALYRYVSYFANGAYTFDNRYTVSLSGRKDGANIFGVKSNDKITPLWSTGIGWNISNEKFYSIEWLDYLKLRATYGFNGNVYLGSAYLTGNSTQAGISGANAIGITNAPNPNLHWERVKNTNIGLDFRAFNSRLSGTIEYYSKIGQDLIEPYPLAPQTGFSKYMANAAGTQTRGFDFTIQSQNVKGIFNWNTTVLLSTLHDKVTKFDVPATSASIQTNGGIPGIEGRPLYGIFSYKWAGLDPKTGDPQGYLNGVVSKDYNGIINNYNKDSVVFNGSARPTVYGSIRNDFAYRGFSLSLNIVYKFGYVFRKSSVSPNYTDILNYYANTDYTKRWQKPGDELHTNVPSFVYPSDANRSTFYTFSEALVESGDHIRLQDIRLGYDLPARFLRKIRVDHLQLFAYANNVGIIWCKNKDGIDPDNYGYGVTHTLPVPFSISFGLTANF